MARIKDPTLFSTYFGLDTDVLEAAGLIDPFIDVDLPLFIDPVLLDKSSNQRISKQGIEAFRGHFLNFIRLLAISKHEGDVAWRGARRLLDLREPPENGLGYGGSGRSGSSRPERIREDIMRTSREIIELGAADPEMISLMGFFEEDVGPDTISDFTTRIIIDQLAEITEEFARNNRIHAYRSDVGSGGHYLPMFSTNRKRKAMVLVPRDIVRDLPIANDWSEIETAALQNDRIRDRVNQLLAGLVKPTIADRKSAMRAAAMGSAEDFSFFLAAVKENVRSYDPNLDALGYYRFKEILANGFAGLKQETTYKLSTGPEEITRLVKDTLYLFKRHVENGNLWEELWIKGKPKKERAAQLIYYAIADAFCKANNVDISPEANMGGGPIDFKFSSGYSARVLVEIKRSSGTVVHGYEKQLEFYKQASQSRYGLFVIIDYGDLGHKLTEITRIRQRRIRNGEQASEIIVIDATPKESASKRK
jgi:hypothetical protein